MEELDKKLKELFPTFDITYKTPLDKNGYEDAVEVTYTDRGAAATYITAASEVLKEANYDKAAYIKRIKADIEWVRSQR